jgi:hypothetical protein
MPATKSRKKKKTIQASPSGIIGGAIIRRSVLDAVGQRTADKKRSTQAGGSSASIVSQDVLSSTGAQFPHCKCEHEDHMANLGKPVLHAGTLVNGPGGLNGISPAWNGERWVSVPGGDGLGTGCTTGWVCPRLDKVRRTYGR